MLTIADLKAGRHALCQLSVQGKDAKPLAACIDRYTRLIAEMEAKAQPEPNQPAPEAK